MTQTAEAAGNRDHAAALTGALIQGGVRHAVLSPGSRNTPTVLALHALAQAGSEVTLHSVLDERSAGFFALGLARSTGTPVVLCCTSGSAGAHYLPAIIEAFHAHIPLIVITADRPPELQGRGAPQTIDQRGMFGPHVRTSLMLGTPDGDLPAVRTAAREALQAAGGAAPGPVHINTPYRKPLWDPGVPATVDLPADPAPSQATPDAPSDEVDTLCGRIEAAKRGLVVWGPDPDPHLDPSWVLELADHLGWPLVATPTSPVRFWHPRPGVTIPRPGVKITTHDAFLRDPDVAASLAPDLVIQLGGTPSSNALRTLVGAAPDVVAIDPRGVWRDPEHSLKALLEVDPGPLARQLIERLPLRKVTPWLQAWQEWEEHARAALADACGEGLWSGSIVQTLVQALPEGALLHAASSMPIRDLDSFGRDGSRFLAHASRGVNGIDGTLATGLGLAAGWTQGPTAVLLGDLAFLHDHGSLLLADKVHGPVVVLVVDNAGGGIFSHLPIAAHPDAFEPWFLTPQSGDIPALCAGAGVPCRQLQTPTALAEALPTALETPGLTVLHLPIERADDLARHRAAWAAAQDR